MEELGEKSVKSDEKGKNVCKSAKRKADTDEEPGSSKKARVGDPRSAGKERLRSQKVLWGRTFAPDILEEAGMRQLVEICEFQQWTHLFTNDAPMVYEEEVQSFYADLFKVEDDHICVLVNGVDMVMDSSLLGSILGVPAEGLSSVHRSCSQNFRNAILKDRAVQQGERVQKKALLPVYQLLFEMVNKVLLPRAERRSITSSADLFLMEVLDNFTTINLPGIMIEHMNKVADFKDGNHGLPYGFLLTKVFKHFKVPLGQAKVGTKKQTFSKATLEECECIEKIGGVGSTSTISQLINAQNSATSEIRKLKARNAILETQLSQL